MQYLIFLIVLFMVSLTEVVNAQKENPTDSTDFYNPDYFRYEDHVYMKGINTVLLHRAGWPLSDALIELNNNEQLLLSFDDLNGFMRDFAYTVIYCDKDWTLSELSAVEYINGLPDDFIIDYKYSRNTKQKYVHYELLFPNDNMQISKSGNYILKVYLADEPDSLVLTKRFMVFESKVDVVAEIKPASTINDRFYKQEVDFTIRWDKYQINDPFDRLHVVLMQNHRWDNAIIGLKPMFVKDKELVYDYNSENAFPAGNEFRFFDIKDMRYKSEGIDSVHMVGENHIYLKPVDKRAFKVYLEKPDINGKRYIKIDERFAESSVDADYTWVHFYLRNPGPLLTGDIYVFGELSNWQMNKVNKMIFNRSLKMFTCSLYLKQGYYNYVYAISNDHFVSPDIGAIEGNHYETENKYTILVYYRQIGSNFDRLIAAETFNSRKNK